MSHFAKIGVDQHVVQIIVIPDEEDSNATTYIRDQLGLDGVWTKAYYSNQGDRRYVDIGYLYLPDVDRFVPPKPYASWVLDDSYTWVPPVPHPKDGLYTWNEAEQRWMSVSLGL